MGGLEHCWSWCHAAHVQVRADEVKWCWCGNYWLGKVYLHLAIWFRSSKMLLHPQHWLLSWHMLTKHSFCHWNKQQMDDQCRLRELPTFMSVTVNGQQKVKEHRWAFLYKVQNLDHSPSTVYVTLSIYCSLNWREYKQTLWVITPKKHTNNYWFYSHSSPTPQKSLKCIENRQRNRSISDSPH